MNVESDTRGTRIEIHRPPSGSDVEQETATP
jgi:hypothetical protein